MVTLNGVVQSPTQAYSERGTTLTFTQVVSDRIEVRKLGLVSTVRSTQIVIGILKYKLKKVQTMIL